jgi:hypothetical protein
LLHHSKVVPYGPVFYDSPISDAHDIDEPNRHPLAGRGVAHKLALMGTIESLSRGDLVPFGDHLLYREIGVGKGLAEHSRDLLDALTVRRHSRWCGVVDELRRAKLVYGVDIPPALNFLDKAADDGPILLDRHGFYSFPMREVRASIMVPSADTVRELLRILPTWRSCE